MTSRRVPFNAGEIDLGDRFRPSVATRDAPAISLPKPIGFAQKILSDGKRPEGPL
jgi:hypothetical protein